MQGEKTAVILLSRKVKTYLGSLCFSLRNSISLSHSIKSSALSPFIILKKDRWLVDR